jgi:hypothetical protein
MGHYMDPKAQIKGFVTRTGRTELIGANMDQCFQSSFLSHSPTNEDFADWMASLVVDKIVQTLDHHLKKQRFTQNAMKVFCLNTKKNLFQKLMSVGDPHSVPRDRVVWFYRQPHLREALDCSSKVIEKKMIIPACSPAIQ